jgi:hypothetical protein
MYRSHVENKRCCQSLNFKSTFLYEFCAMLLFLIVHTVQNNHNKKCILRTDTQNWSNIGSISEVFATVSLFNVECG